MELHECMGAALCVRGCASIVISYKWQKVFYCCPNRIAFAEDASCDMAEVVGLTTGVVALASLFSTCVDLFDRYELAKDFADDYQLARTKLWVLKDRLTGWGDALNVSDPGSEDEILRRYWPEQRDSVYHSLSSIQILFGNACALAHKYDCLPGNCCSFTHLLPSTNNCSCFTTSTKLGAKS